MKRIIVVAEVEVHSEALSEDKIWSMLKERIGEENCFSPFNAKRLVTKEFSGSEVLVVLVGSGRDKQVLMEFV